MVSPSPIVAITRENGEELPSLTSNYPFRVEVTVPSSGTPAPTIEIELSTGGDTETLELAWTGNVGGSPVYKSNPITIFNGAEGGGELSVNLGPLGSYATSTGGMNGLSYVDGDQLTVTFGDQSSTAEVYDSWHTLTIDKSLGWLRAQEVYWTSVQEQLLALPDSDERSKWLETAGNRLEAIPAATRVIENDELWASQRAAAAEFYVERIGGMTDETDMRTWSDGINPVLDNARTESLDVITDEFGNIVLGFYDVFTHATMSAQVLEVFGMDIYGGTLTTDERILAAFDLAGGLALEAIGFAGGTTRIRQGAGRGGPRQIAEPPTIIDSVKNVPVGTPVSHLSYGLLDDGFVHIRHVADEFGVVIEVRPANIDSMPWQALGNPRKPEKIKQKTINEVDVHLGADPDNIGLVGYYEPTLPDNINDLDPKLQKDVRERYDQRSREFLDGQQELGDMEAAGKIRLENGTIIDTGLSGGTGLPFTGDYDPWRITRDGVELDAVEAQPIIDSLSAGPAKAQHGAHVNWDAPPSLAHIDEKIRNGHRPTEQGGKGETILAIGGHGTGPARTTYSGVDVIPGSTGPSMGDFSPSWRTPDGGWRTDVGGAAAPAAGVATRGAEAALGADAAGDDGPASPPPEPVVTESSSGLPFSNPVLVALAVGAIGIVAVIIALSQSGGGDAQTNDRNDTIVGSVNTPSSTSGTTVGSSTGNPSTSDGSTGSNSSGATQTAPTATTSAVTVSNLWGDLVANRNATGDTLNLGTEEEIPYWDTQFRIEQPHAGCDVAHAHSDVVVYAFENWSRGSSGWNLNEALPREDPDPDGCGYGAIDDLNGRPVAVDGQSFIEFCKKLERDGISAGMRRQCQFKIDAITQ